MSSWHTNQNVVSAVCHNNVKEKNLAFLQVLFLNCRHIQRWRVPIHAMGNAHTIVCTDYDRCCMWSDCKNYYIQDRSN